MVLHGILRRGLRLALCSGVMFAWGALGCCMNLLFHWAAVNFWTLFRQSISRSAGLQHVILKAGQAARLTELEPDVSTLPVPYRCMSSCNMQSHTNTDHMSPGMAVSAITVV